MKVRPGKHSDVAAIISAASKFAASTSYANSDAVRENHVLDVVRSTFENPKALVAILETDEGKFAGVFMGLLHPSLLSGDAVAVEIFLWVEPYARGHGKKLLSYFEDWAAERNCVDVALSHPASEGRVGRLFQAWGYSPSEHWYRKKL